MTLHAERLPETESVEQAAEAAARETVQLGDRVLELDAPTASAVREALGGLARSYGEQLEAHRRQVLDSLGSQQWAPPQAPAPQVPDFEVPDPDLLFSNKDAWEAGLRQSVEARMAALEQRQTGMVAGAVAAVDEELRRRDQAAEARALHDQAMEAMLERRGLNAPAQRRLVQAIYQDSYRDLVHLPLETALDQIGAMAQQDIAALGGGKAESPKAEEKPAGPALLRSSRRAAPGPAPVAAAPKTISELIRARQQERLRAA